MIMQVGHYSKFVSKISPAVLTVCNLLYIRVCGSSFWHETVFVPPYFLLHPPKFDSSPLKSDRIPIGKYIVFQPPFPRGELLNFEGYTLHETNSSPLKIGRAPKGNGCIPTIHFQVIWLLVSGRVCSLDGTISPKRYWLFVSCCSTFSRGSRRPEPGSLREFGGKSPNKVGTNLPRNKEPLQK